jgi:hypothetical protein
VKCFFALIAVVFIAQWELTFHLYDLAYLIHEQMIKFVLWSKLEMKERIDIGKPKFQSILKALIYRIPQ